MTVRSMLVAATILVIMSLTTGVADANLIVNGSFETPATTYYVLVNPGAEPVGFGFFVLSGNVEVDKTQVAFGANAVDGSQSLDLDGSEAGAIGQSFATVPGQAYDVQLYYQPRQRRI